MVSNSSTFLPATKWQSARLDDAADDTYELATRCCLRFAVQFLDSHPLLAAVVVEVVFLKLAGLLSSAFWDGMVLMCSLEIGYFVGAMLRQRC